MGKIIKKECKIHGETDFILRNDKRYRCKKCSVDAVTKRRDKLKKMSIEYKGGKCETCGYNKCNRALTFHHLDPTKKEFALSRANISWDKVKAELDKCVLLCFNCHMELHEKIDKEKLM
jgi:hypothetical protein